MPSTLRSIKINDPSNYIRRRQSKEYPGFPDHTKCWEQSKGHKTYFLKHARCRELGQYHRQETACKKFDDLVKNWAGDEYGTTFFSYYKTTGRAPASYTQRTVTSKRDLDRLCDIPIIKLDQDDIVGDEPDDFVDWPAHFDLQAVIMLFDAADKLEILQSVESCLKRRLLFREVCIKRCNSKLADSGHDHILLVLQILRARLLVKSRVRG